MTSPLVPTATAARTVSGAWGLLTAVLLIMLGNGLLGTLVALRAGVIGFGTTLTGIVMAGYYVGFFLGAWAVPRFVLAVGHIRVYAALASLASTAALVHLLTGSPFLWGLMRVITGFGLSGIYIVAESWLNDSADNSNRGLLISVYMVVVMGGLALSQTLLPLFEPSAATPFILSSVLVSLAVVPVTLSVGAAPSFEVHDRMRFAELWHAAPIGIVGGFAAGFTGGAMAGLGAVYADLEGFSVARVGLFMALMLAGPVAFQLPIGHLSDRFRRRRVLLLTTLVSAGLALWIAQVDATSALMLVAIFVYGGITFPLYSLALSHINDVVPRGQGVAVSSIYVFVGGVGAVAGPPIVAATMDRTSPSAFFWTQAILLIGVAAYSLYRIVAHQGVEVDQQRRFANVPARAGHVIIQMTRRRSRRRVTSSGDANRGDG